MAVEHSNAKSIHMFAHISDIDPGAIGADKAWVDPATSPPKLKIRNKQNDGWITIGGDFTLEEVLDAVQEYLGSEFLTFSDGIVLTYNAVTKRLNIGFDDSESQALLNERLEAIEAEMLTKQPKIQEYLYTTGVEIPNGSSTLLELPVNCKICLIDSLQVNKNCLLKIYLTEDTNEGDLIINKNLVANTEPRILASPVPAKTSSGTLWMLITNNDASGLLNITVKFTPIAL